VRIPDMVVSAAVGLTTRMYRQITS
jgi:hypothetical protein